jgi:hypothetical protein
MTSHLRFCHQDVLMCLEYLDIDCAPSNRAKSAQEHNAI